MFDHFSEACTSNALEREAIASSTFKFNVHTNLCAPEEAEQQRPSSVWPVTMINPSDLNGACFSRLFYTCSGTTKSSGERWIGLLGWNVDALRSKVSGAFDRVEKSNRTDTMAVEHISPFWQSSRIWIRLPVCRRSWRGAKVLDASSWNSIHCINNYSLNLLLQLWQ